MTRGWSYKYLVYAPRTKLSVIIAIFKKSLI